MSFASNMMNNVIPRLGHIKDDLSNILFLLLEKLEACDLYAKLMVKQYRYHDNLFRFANKFGWSQFEEALLKILKRKESRLEFIAKLSGCLKIEQMQPKQINSPQILELCRKINISE